MYEQDDYTENHLFTYSVLENQIQGLSRTFIHRFKTFKNHVHFQGLQRPGKSGKKFKDFQRLA